MGCYFKIKTQVSSPEKLPARLWRSTGPVDRTKSRSTGPIDRRAQNVHADQPLGPVDRAVDRLQVPHSRVGAVDRPVDRKAWTVDRAREHLLSGLARSTGPVDHQPPRLKISPNG